MNNSNTIVNPAIAYRDDNTCTLNGKPAVIQGWLLRFGWVCTLDGSQKVEFCWDTIARIMDRDRTFKA